MDELNNQKPNQDNEDHKEVKLNRINVVRHKWPDEIAAEKRRTRVRILIILLCIGCFVLGYVISGANNKTQSTTNTNSETKLSTDKLNQVYEIMKDKWYFGKDIQNLNSTLLENAIKGMVKNDADTHTEYLNASDATSLTNSLSGSFVGIGILLYDSGDYCGIDKVYIDSPAEKVGMQPGDIIIKVDGVSVKGWSTAKLANKVRGDKGTKVTVEVKRGNTTKTFKVTRDNINVSSYGYIDANGNGVLQLDSFADTTADEVGKYLANFKKHDVKKLIIDLRNNGGGYVDTAVEIASYLLDKDSVIIYEKDKAGNSEAVKVNNDTTRYHFDKMAVLVNNQTASASEILATALKAHLNCEIVGVQSYGKATIQNTMQFTDGSYFKYTIYEWLTADKQAINKKGITPDYVVKLDDALTYSFSDDDKSYKVDSVGNSVKDAQILLKFLGYGVDRKDGYFSNATLNAVKQFQSDKGLTVTGVIDSDLKNSLSSYAVQYWHDQKTKLDSQMQKAVEVVDGK